MTSQHTHEDHSHTHGPDCEHIGVQHEGHVDYLHDGHLHHQRADGTVEEHTIPVSGKNPADCTPHHACDAHDPNHQHGAGCGHEPVRHGDHNDYLVDGHLHHPHKDHCDNHGPVQLVN